MKIELVQDQDGFAAGAGTQSTLAPPIIITGARTQMPSATLRLHLFRPPASNEHAKMLAPWAKMIKA